MNSHNSLPLLLFLIKAVIVLIIPLVSLEPKATLALYINLGLATRDTGREHREHKGEGLKGGLSIVNTRKTKILFKA